MPGAAVMWRPHLINVLRAKRVPRSELFRIVIADIELNAAHAYALAMDLTRQLGIYADEYEAGEKLMRAKVQARLVGERSGRAT